MVGSGFWAFSDLRALIRQNYAPFCGKTRFASGFPPQRAPFLEEFLIFLLPDACESGTSQNELFDPGHSTKRQAYSDSIMDGQNKERWFQLCELAAAEQDPNELLRLVTEINRLLEEKEERLKRHTTSSWVPRKKEGDPNSQDADSEI
jgi:hypothetical protein